MKPEPRVLDPHLERLGDHDHRIRSASLRARAASATGSSSPTDCPSVACRVDQLPAGARRAAPPRGGRRPAARTRRAPRRSARGRRPRPPRRRARGGAGRGDRPRPRHAYRRRSSATSGRTSDALLPSATGRRRAAGRAPAADDTIRRPRCRHRCGTRRSDGPPAAGQARGFSRISKVSITSSTLMSLNDPRPIPHSKPSRTSVASSLNRSQRLDGEVVGDDRAVADQPRLGVAADRRRSARGSRRCCRTCWTRKTSRTSAVPSCDLLELRLEHALERRLDLVDGLVDDRVVADVDALAVGQLARPARPAGR